MSMRRYSFIEESKRHLLKILSRYTPEQQRKITDRLISLGKENGGLHSPNEYGRRMIDGQIKKIRKLAKSNNRNIDIFRVSNPLDSKTNINGSIIDPHNKIHRLSKSAADSIDKGNDSVFIPSAKSKISSKDKETFGIKPGYRNSLTSALNATHEADEYSEVLRNAKRLGISPDAYAMLDKSATVSSGNHFSHYKHKVLKREKKTKKLLDRLFGKDSSFHVPRSKEEMKVSSIPLERYWNEVHPNKELGDIDKMGQISLANRIHQSRINPK